MLGVGVLTVAAKVLGEARHVAVADDRRFGKLLELVFAKADLDGLGDEPIQAWALVTGHHA